MPVNTLVLIQGTRDKDKRWKQQGLILECRRNYIKQYLNKLLGSEGTTLRNGRFIKRRYTVKPSINAGTQYPTIERQVPSLPINRPHLEGSNDISSRDPVDRQVIIAEPSETIQPEDTAADSIVLPKPAMRDTPPEVHPIR